MDEIVKTCCFTGPRPKNYPWGRDKECEAKIEEKLKIAVQEAVERGYRHFISGMSAGIDLLAAKIVLQLRGDMTKMEITLEKKQGKMFIKMHYGIKQYTVGYMIKKEMYIFK